MNGIYRGVLVYVCFQLWSSSCAWSRLKTKLASTLSLIGLLAHAQDRLQHATPGNAHPAVLEQARLGFALHVAPSGVDHPEAGAGLWLRGRALPGAVVALYPGIVYSRPHLRCARCTRTVCRVLAQLGVISPTTNSSCSRLFTLAY